MQIFNQKSFSNWMNYKYKNTFLLRTGKKTCRRSNEWMNRNAYAMLTAPRSLRNSADCPLLTNLLYMCAVSLDHDLSTTATLLMMLLLFFFISFFHSFYYLFLNCFPLNECHVYSCYKVDLRLCIPLNIIRQMLCSNQCWPKKVFVFIFWH